MRADLDAGRVTAVDIYDGGRTAVIEAVDPDLDNRVQRLRVADIVLFNGGDSLQALAVELGRLAHRFGL